MTDRNPAGRTAFAKAAAAGRLVAPRCAQCGQWGAPFTFRGVAPSACRSCQGRELSWDAVSGEAVLVTWTVLPSGRPAGVDGELVTGVVELTEGPWLPCRVEVPPSERRAGLAVEVGFDLAVDGPSVGVPVCRAVGRGGSR